jgi:hypothetical protein
MFSYITYDTMFKLKQTYLSLQTFISFLKYKKDYHHLYSSSVSLAHNFLGSAGVWTQEF